MLLLDKFGWQICQPIVIALLVGSSVIGWASDAEALKPCTRHGTWQEREDSHSSVPSGTSPAEKHRTSAAVGFCPALFAQDFFSDQKPDKRVLPSACEKIACTESIKLAWPALKHVLDELYVAVSLGKRASILAQLKQIVPQFTYTGCDQPGSVVGVVRELHEVPPLVDRSELPFEPRR